MTAASEKSRYIFSSAENNDICAQSSHLNRKLSTPMCIPESSSWKPGMGTQLTLAIPRRSPGPPGRKPPGIMAANDCFARSGTDTSLAHSNGPSSSTKPLLSEIISTYDDIFISNFSKVFGLQTTPTNIEICQFHLATRSRGVWPV